MELYVEFMTRADKFKNSVSYILSPDAMYNSSEWIYSFVESIFVFEFREFYFKLAQTYFDDYFNYFFKIYWFFINELNEYELLYSIYLDHHIKNSLNTLVLNNSYYDSILYLGHPELNYISDSITINFELDFINYIVFQYTSLVTNEIITTAIDTASSIIIYILFFFWLYTFYCSFFSSSTEEEALIDSDYMLANITIEAEEEISCMDDLVMMFVLLFYIYGWYFFTHFWFIATKIPEFVLLIYLFPFLYYIIIGIPVFLLFDFGIFFIGYLKGVASTPVFILELIFDYVAVMAFFIRILVQGVRLLLMIFTYASLHDFILFYNFNQNYMTGNEALLDEWNNLSTNIGSFSYFFFFSILSKLYYWLYELLHTFFVLTAQFTAFFAMVFWLFFFLYTFFVLEKQEAYFGEKRDFFQKNKISKFKILI